MICKRLSIPTTGGEVRLDAYLPDLPSAPRPAVIICPGGAYFCLAEREAEPVALDFAADGFSAFVLYYRLAPNRFPCQQQDAAAAIGYIRRHAQELGCDPGRIALMGFSAGGHLAASMGVLWHREELWTPLGMSPQEVRPDALVLCYAAACTDLEPLRTTVDQLMGVENEEHLSVDRLVRADTPPAFLWHTWDDGMVPPEHTLRLALALKRAGVQAEVHVYPHGVHGLSLARETSASRAEHIVPECQDWPLLARRFLRNVSDPRIPRT